GQRRAGGPGGEAAGGPVGDGGRVDRVGRSDVRDAAGRQGATAHRHASAAVEDGRGDSGVLRRAGAQRRRRPSQDGRDVRRRRQGQGPRGIDAPALDLDDGVGGGGDRADPEGGGGAKVVAGDVHGRGGRERHVHARQGPARKAGERRGVGQNGGREQ